MFVDYRTTDDAVYFGDTNVPDADPNTFEVLNHQWALDATSVFNGSTRIKAADRDTFEVLNPLFARDKAHVLVFPDERRGPVLRLADVESFEVLDAGMWELTAAPEPRWCGYGRDQKRVFVSWGLETSVLRGADPASFESLGFAFAKDSNYTWFEGHRLRADSNTFEVLGENYARDAQRVFFQHEVVPKADPAAIRLIHPRWATDNKQIYFGHQAIPDADRASFEIVDALMGVARDSNSTYHGAMPVGDDWLIQILVNKDTITNRDLLIKIVEAYRRGSRVEVDEACYTGREIAKLLKEWRDAVPFLVPFQIRLSRRDNVLFEMDCNAMVRLRAAMSEWPFLAELTQHDLCTIVPQPPEFFALDLAMKSFWEEEMKARQKK